MDSLQQRLEVAGPQRVERRGEAVPEARQELLEPGDLERVGFLVDAVQPRHVAGVEELRNRLVGEQHELLDDAVRDVPLARDDLFDPPLLVQHDLGLLEIEVDRAEAAAAVLEDLEQLAHPLEQGNERVVLRRRFGALVGQDGVDVGVGHSLAGANDAVVELVAHHLAAPVHLHEARLHEPVHARVEAAEARGELLREHVERALGEVHRGAALVGLGIECAALAHVVRDVRDVHAEPVVPVRQRLDRNRIVEVAGVLAVDRHDVEAAEVGAPRKVLLAGVRGARGPAALDHAPGLGHGFVAVLRPAGRTCG